MPTKGRGKALVWVAWIVMATAVPSMVYAVTELLAAGTQEHEAGRFSAFAKRADDGAKQAAYVARSEKFTEQARHHYTMAALAGGGGIVLMLCAVGLLARQRRRRISDLVAMHDRLGEKEATGQMTQVKPPAEGAASAQAAAKAAEPKPEPTSTADAKPEPEAEEPATPDSDKKAESSS